MAMLAARPWASVDDAHATPRAAVDAFLAWADAIAMASWGESGYRDAVVAEYVGADQRSGEIEFHMGQTGSGDPSPVTIVIVRQAGPDDNWWVVGTVSEDAVITEPAAEAIIESPLRFAGETVAISDGVVLRIYADGDNTPLFAEQVTGGGVFALGAFGGDESDDTATVEWLPPDGGTGMVVFVTPYGVSTVPVAFAGV